MRMWMVNPKCMCRKHLLGESGELHKFMHNWKKKHSISGRIKTNAMEPLSYKKRHDKLAKEMIRRGYNHKSPLQQPDFSYLPKEEREYKIDLKENERELKHRCPECRELFLQNNLKECGF